MNAIVLSFGSLHTNMLGCYGGQGETPALDSFACDGFVFDQCYVESPVPHITRRNWWTGCLQSPAFNPDLQSVASAPSLLSALRDRRVRTVLIRDTAPLLDASRDVAAFDQVIELAREGEDTCADIIDSAASWLSEHTGAEPFLLFLDCQGLNAFTEPKPTASEQRDPLVTEFMSQLDQEAGRFLEWLQAGHHWTHSLIAFTSDLGCQVARGEHGPQSKFDLSDLHVHVPLLVRYPGVEPWGRSSALVQSVDLMPTILDALGIAPPPPVDGMSLLPICRGEQGRVRDFVRLSAPSGMRAVRTANWYLIAPPPCDAGAPELKLFAKPEDRWEHNDVARQYPETVVELNALLEEMSH